VKQVIARKNGFRMAQSAAYHKHCFKMLTSKTLNDL